MEEMRRPKQSLALIKIGLVRAARKFDPEVQCELFRGCSGNPGGTRPGPGLRPGMEGVWWQRGAREDGGNAVDLRADRA